MNQGAIRLRAVKDKREETQAEIATALGIDQGMVSHWLRGERKPSAKYRGLLEREFGIGWQLWDEESADGSPATDDPPASETSPLPAAEHPPTGTGN